MACAEIRVSRRSSALAWTLALVLACLPALHAAEFEVVDKLTANGYTLLKSSVEVRGLLGVSTGAPFAALDVVSTGTASNIYAQLWRNGGGTIVSSMSSTGVMMAARFVGDGSGITNLAGAGDNLGNHVATTTLQMGAYSVSTSSNITAARYQINGSTVLAILSGTGNLSVGVNAGRVHAENYSVFVGYQAGYNNSSGGQNSFVGSNAGFTSDSAWYNSFFGANAGYYNTSGGQNTFVGHEAGYTNAAGASNTFVGKSAGYSNTASDNSFFGSGAGVLNGTGYNNTFIGRNAGSSNTSGYNNSFVGLEAGRQNTTASGNSILGVAAGLASNGSYNSMVGYAAMYRNTTGGGNTAVGYQAGYGNETGSANAILGFEAGKGAGTNSFSSSTLAGYRAGYGLTTGSDNILLGWQAGDALATGARNIIIGYDQDASASGASNELNIGGVLYGDLSSKTIGISTRAPQAALDIVSTGTAANVYAQIWRNGDGVIKGSMSATGVLMAAKFVGDGSGLTGVGGGEEISVSTINAAAATPYGGVNITTNTFVNGNLGVGLKSPAAALHVQAYVAGAYNTYLSTSSIAGSYSVAVSSLGLTNVNNLVIENRASDPAAPVTGQIWLRID